MKKVTFLIIVLMSIFTSCSLEKEPEPIDFLSHIAEYDNINFDFEEYIDRMVSSGNATLEKHANDNHCLYWEGSSNGKRRVIIINIYDDVATAKEKFKNQLELTFCTSETFRCYIRVDNATITSVPETTEQMLELYDEMGIERPEMIKINGDSKIEKRKTNKPPEDIIAQMQSMGYRVVNYRNHIDTEKYFTRDWYTFLSEDGREVYELSFTKGMFANEQNDAFIEVQSAMSWEHVSFFYSKNDNYAITFFGDSINTESLWETLRK